MAYPAYLRARARELRIKNHLSLDELAKHLALPKTTIYYWIKDLPLGRERRESPHNGTRAMQAKYRRLREAAYEQGQAEYDELLARADVPRLRGALRRGGVQAKSQPGQHRQLRPADGRDGDRLATLVSHRSRSATAVQYHADQDLEKLRAFWGSRLEIDGSHIRLQRKSNSGQLEGRTWRSEHGVLTVCVNDTALRARLQAWIDLVRDDWH